MKNKEDIINEILSNYKDPNYVEIGFGDGYNFDKINAHYKLGVEPEYDGERKDVFKGNSDDFFENNDNDIDVFFIDGLHHADQVRKDISNALKCNPKAVILHDSIPPDEAHQIVPRKQKQFCGDVWRAAVGFIESYPDVRVETYRSDYGVSVIYPEGKKVRKHFENKEMTFEEFKENEVELLNIID